jgi:hypothetical protein
MRINESRIRRIIREEARRVLREMDDDFDGEHEDDVMTADGVIEQYKDEGSRSWMRVSNDFHEMARGGMEDVARKYYPGLDEDDFRRIADELDTFFGMD